MKAGMNVLEAVTRKTCGWCLLVSLVDVTLLAANFAVHALQRKFGSVMVETHVLPAALFVTCTALGTQASLVRFLRPVAVDAP
jgi:hypothetical protein